MVLYTPPQDIEGQPLATAGTPHLPYELEETGNTITNKQLFYIFIPQGLGAAVIDAGANFGVACAMYRTTRKEIRLWPLDKNTIAGDMGVTVVIQGVLTMLITSALVRWDIRTGRIQPFPFPWPRGERWRGRAGITRYMARAIEFLSPTQTLSISFRRYEFWETLFIILLRGFIISVFYFCLVWPLAIAIIAPLYGGVNMRGTWIPQAIKAVFGGILGLTMNPLVAALVLGASITPPTRGVSKPKIATTTPIVPASVVQSELRQDVLLPMPEHPRGVAPEI